MAKKEIQNKKQNETVIMNFSGIYKNQQFYRNPAEVQEEISWVEVQDLPGSNCYCDGEAKEKMMKALQPYNGEGIHFIDSGNYHYVSRLWIEKVQKPFRLLVFDNHTDMQLPAFGGLLSCGGWIAASLEELPMLKQVVLIGPDEDAFAQVEPQFREKVQFLSREQLKMMTWKEKSIFFEELCTDLPLYVSVDKDVLCAEDAVTTWSQGDMTLGELKCFLEIILRQQPVIGMDICGECDPDACENDVLNDRANQEILQLWRKCLRQILERRQDR
ncbi:arginase family protein [Blautia sp. MSJ-19]|uniref:arginase family protein n=1 Tax=Blautia sp. MSJ-19 TaxID=2841517 RepID=UPI001C0EBB43|nr:arginase family protein [Blautia sp. MSJ-19]MBU5479710.1 arginase family protein [Blautia sp. MSJ-19]